MECVCDNKSRLTGPFEGDTQKATQSTGQQGQGLGLCKTTLRVGWPLSAAHMHPQTHYQPFYKLARHSKPSLCQVNVFPPQIPGCIRCERTAPVCIKKHSSGMRGTVWGSGRAADSSWAAAAQLCSGQITLLVGSLKKPCFCMLQVSTMAQEKLRWGSFVLLTLVGLC